MDAPKPRTRLQRQTSIRNGSKSRCSVTARVESVSRMNRVTHGLTAPQARLPEEDTPEERDRYRRLMAQLDPQTELQWELAERIDDAIVLRKRGRRALHGKLQDQHRRARDPFDPKIAR